MQRLNGTLSPLLNRIGDGGGGKVSSCRVSPLESNWSQQGGGKVLSLPSWIELVTEGEEKCCLSPLEPNWSQ